MKSLAEKLQEIIQEGSRTQNDEDFKKFEQLLGEMKKSGVIKQPNYTLPLVDTIGKTYYSSINKREYY